MAEAKLAPNMPDWQVQHANRYLESGGTEGATYTVDVPGRGKITAPALLLTTTGRKSGNKFIFPLFYGTDGDSYIIVASKGGAPEHPGWYRNLVANPDVEVQVGTKKLKARARTATGEERGATLEKGARVLAALCRLCAQDRTRNPCRRAGSHPLTSRDSGAQAYGTRRSATASRRDSAVGLPPTALNLTGRTNGNPTPVNSRGLRSPGQASVRAPDGRQEPTCVRRPRQGRWAPSGRVTMRSLLAAAIDFPKWARQTRRRSIRATLEPAARPRSFAFGAPPYMSRLGRAKGSDYGSVRSALCRRCARGRRRERRRQLRTRRRRAPCKRRGLLGRSLTKRNPGRRRSRGGRSVRLRRAGRSRCTLVRLG